MLSPSRFVWLAALIAGFMVAVLPVCWFGALERVAAERLQTNAPLNAPSNNNEEEREHHNESESHHKTRSSARPPQAGTVVVRTVSYVDHPPVSLRTAQVPDPHPAKLSTRLLI